MSDEVPSNDWTWNVGLDGLELVGLAPYLDHDVLCTIALDLVSIDGLQAGVGIRLISMIRWPGADLGTGIDEDLLAVLGDEMGPYVDPLMAHSP